ncbi:MAG: adenylate/guanylate cyclase domain-containing protein [Rubricoccaceae bacterium]|nr:adenylate/guanylate cyclase domain-containing protein [Rubricoccaceae bacterium]
MAGDDERSEAALREENERLRRAVDELSVLNETATALSQAEDLQTALGALVRRSCRATGAAQGVIVLVEEHAHDERAPTPPTLVRSVATSEREALRPGISVVGWIQRYRQPLLVADPAGDPRFPGAEWPEAVRNILAVPMLARGRLVGVLAHYNSPSAAGFSNDDARLLGILAAQSAQAVERMRIEEARQAAEAARAEVTRLFGQHTAPSVVEALVGQGGEVPVRRQEVCVLFLDLRGFTRQSEDQPPEDVVAYLNTFFALATDVVNGHGGIVHQLLGDGFMAYFGVPEPDPTAPARAVGAAREIVARVAAACAEGTLAPTRLGIGIHAGEAVTGPVGSAIHREYKVTGDVVNTAARIEKLCKQFEAQLLVSEAVWQRLGDEAAGEPLGPIALEGRRQPIVLYRLA